MIPKIIHYCWISDDPKPELVKHCMATWKKHLPDYEFILWDARRISEEINNTFVDEAISVRKWAFAADYVRCFAVYKYGGIYLDTDVEVLQSFDDFLNDKMFIGQECIAYYLRGMSYKYTRLTSHCFGAVSGHPFMIQCLDYYKDRKFILSPNKNLPDSMRFDQTLLPMIHTLLLQNYGYNIQAYYYNKEQALSEGIRVYPSYYFDIPKGFYVKKKIYCIHQCMGGWRDVKLNNKPKDYRTWQLWCGRIMSILNFIPHKFGLEIGISFVKW